MKIRDCIPGELVTDKQQLDKRWIFVGIHPWEQSKGKYCIVADRYNSNVYSFSTNRIIPVDRQIEVTLDEIASRYGISKENLIIKE